MSEQSNQLSFDENKLKRSRGAEEDGQSKSIEWQTQMECSGRKRAAVIEIHFHLDGWAEHFSEADGQRFDVNRCAKSSWSNRTGTLHPFESELFATSENFSQTLNTQPLRQTSKRNCNVILF